MSCCQAALQELARKALSPDWWVVIVGYQGYAVRDQSSEAPYWISESYRQWGGTQINSGKVDCPDASFNLLGYFPVVGQSGSSFNSNRPNTSSNYITPIRETITIGTDLVINQLTGSPLIVDLPEPYAFAYKIGFSILETSPEQAFSDNLVSVFFGDKKGIEALLRESRSETEDTFEYVGNILATDESGAYCKCSDVGLPLVGADINGLEICELRTTVNVSSVYGSTVLAACPLTCDCCCLAAELLLEKLQSLFV